jgi:hypothetical protein
VRLTMKRYLSVGMGRRKLVVVSDVVQEDVRKT